jgi:hypothetical protein
MALAEEVEVQHIPVVEAEVQHVLEEEAEEQLVLVAWEEADGELLGAEEVVADRGTSGVEVRSINRYHRQMTPQRVAEASVVP